MQILLAFLLASTLAVADERPVDGTEIPACSMAPSWLRVPHPYEFGDLSHLSPLTAYLVADGHDPETLTYEVTPVWWQPYPTLPSIGAGPQNLGPIVEMKSPVPSSPAGMIWLVKARNGADCAVYFVYVPRDHGHGQ